MRLSISVAVLFFSLSCFAAEQSKIKKDTARFLETMRDVYRVAYAPKEWKKKFAGWDLETAFQQAKEHVEKTEALNLFESQKILVDFVGSMKDYHVSIQFYSTEKASLP